MPKISVIIPTYNCGQYIKEAVDSVLNQTFNDFELIVVDDGSTDNTDEILLAYHDKIIYLKQPNKGSSAARNTGIRASKGEWVAFLDADDKWYLNKLELQVDLIDKIPDADVIFSDFEYFGDPNTKYKTGFTHHRNLSLIEKRSIADTYILITGENFMGILTESYACIGTLLVKKQCFREIGLFDDSLLNTEDYQMMLRLSRNFKFAFVNRILARIRQRQDSKCRIKTTTEAEQAVIMFLGLDKVIPGLNKEEKCMIRNHLKHLTFNLGYFHFDRYDFISARRYFIDSLSLDFSLKTILYLYIACNPKMLVRLMRKLKSILQIRKPLS